MAEISCVLFLVLPVELVVELAGCLAPAGGKEISNVLFLELMVELVAAPVKCLAQA